MPAFGDTGSLETNQSSTGGKARVSAAAAVMGSVVNWAVQILQVINSLVLLKRVEFSEMAKNGNQLLCHCIMCLSSYYVQGYG